MRRARRCIGAATASLLLLFGAIGLTGSAVESAHMAGMVNMPPGGPGMPNECPDGPGGPVLSLNCAVTRESLVPNELS